MAIDPSLRGFILRRHIADHNPTALSTARRRRSAIRQTTDSITIAIRHNRAGNNTHTPRRPPSTTRRIPNLPNRAQGTRRPLNPFKPHQFVHLPPNTLFQVFPRFRLCPHTLGTHSSRCPVKRNELVQSPERVVHTGLEDSAVFEDLGPPVSCESPNACALRERAFRLRDGRADTEPLVCAEFLKGEREIEVLAGKG